jgi:hypothetical protein
MGGASRSIQVVGDPRHPEDIVAAVRRMLHGLRSLVAAARRDYGLPPLPDTTPHTP